jgi:selT/selW/selH-like putative selenoprotein
MQAVSLKESIEGQLKIPTRIRLGAPGALDVLVDGQKIYSKKQTGRLPAAEEIIKLIRDRG